MLIAIVTLICSNVIYAYLNVCGHAGIAIVAFVVVTIGILTQASSYDRYKHLCYVYGAALLRQRKRGDKQQKAY